MRRSSCALLVAAVLAVSVGATSCGGGGGGGDPDLVLVAFNKPNVAGILLNEPLIFTFSTSIDAASITPDTLRVTGAVGPFFERTVVDGNLVALLPRSPNFEDYSDAGYAVSTTYSVDFAVFPAVSTIKTLSGSPLLDAEGYQFSTVPTPIFGEPRRPINHGVPPSRGGQSDDDGCLQNSDNSLYDEEIQFGSGPGAKLLCLKNEGPPRVILDECSPTHAVEGVGTPSAVTEGTVNLPALRVRYNEPLDPITVVPHIPTAKLGLNVQLWRVGDTDKVPIPPEPIRTNQPLIVQSLEQIETILVPSNEDEFGNPIGGVPQGTYMINLTRDVTDLPGNALVISDSPDADIGGFGAIDENVNASGYVAPGYRIYFVTLKVPGTAQSFGEGYNTNLNEWGDESSGMSEPGVYEQSDPGAQDLRVRIPGATADAPSFTLQYDVLQSGQTTTANWNGGLRFMNLPVEANTDTEVGTGRLRASFRPWTGTGADGAFETSGAGSVISLSTDAVPGSSVNGDGVYEYESFHLKAADTLNVSGSRPLVILCRGDVTIEGSINLPGMQGGPGLDTDGTEIYTNPGAASTGGAGGEGAPGGGAGGGGAVVASSGFLDGLPGETRVTIFGAVPATDPTGLGGAGAESPDQESGSGGGLGGVGGDGSTADGTAGPSGGAVIGDATLGRAVDLFGPDRGYAPSADISGGPGGGGGGAEDTDGNGFAQNGDAGGGGGGGAGGGIYILAAGEVSVSGAILCNGGTGGNTYATEDHQINLGADDAPGGEDADADFVVGPKPEALPSGAGGPGGGGAGGVILLMGADGVTVSASAQLEANGGDGGESGEVDLVGGAGGDGKIVIGTVPGGSVIVDGGATVSPSETALVYRPTVDLNSSGVSTWYDMFTNTAVFFPPQWESNFQALEDVGLTLGVDFEAVIEFQGAASLDPLPGGSTPPSSAPGLTQWNADPASIDGSRYMRYRWRFRVAQDYPAWPDGVDEAVQLPAILDLTIQFSR